MQTMKRPYQIASIILFLFSAFMAYESLRLKFYTPLGPGPGFFPFWLSIVLALLSMSMFYQSTFKKAELMPENFIDSRRGYLRGLAICGSWVWAIAMLETLGYRLAMMAFFPFLLLTLGRVRWYTIIALTFLGTVVAFSVFTRVLMVILPVGPFDFVFEPFDSLLEKLI